MGFDYYYGSQAEQFNYIKIPKALLTKERFSPLSLQAKILYGLLLDRMGLSIKNEWFDKENKVYIIYQISEIQDDLGFSKKKAIEYLGELEKFGLVEKKKRGFGLPSIIYVKNFITDEDKNIEGDENGTSRGVDLGTSGESEKDENDVKECHININIVKNIGENTEISPRGVDLGTSRSVDLGTSRGVDSGTSGGVDLGTSEVSISEPLNNKTNINNTYKSKNESNQILSDHIPFNQDSRRLDEMEKYSLYKEIIKENIEYESLVEESVENKDLLDEIVELILEILMGNAERIVIASNSYPAEMVKSKMLKLNQFHIEYVLDCIKSNTTEVHNIKKYLMATLFNAPNTMTNYYQARVNHDYPEFV